MVGAAVPAGAGAGADLFGGVSRNFQVFDPLDLLAEITQHVPDPWEHLVRYYGWYSNKSRGLRAKSRKDGGDAHGGDADSERTVAIDDAPAPGQLEIRRRWARLIQRVFEVDPLTCPKCGGRMTIVAFIESCQQDVIQRILRHLGLDPQSRTRPDPRAPPPGRPTGREAGAPRPVHEPDGAEHRCERELRYVPDLDQRAHLAPDEGPQVDPRVEAQEAHDPESWDPAF